MLLSIPIQSHYYERKRIMRLFEAKDLTKKYDKAVLNHLDFSIDEGEVVGIIGVSGCGKSTLARLVSGIEKPSFQEMWSCNGR